MCISVELDVTVVLMGWNQFGGVLRVVPLLYFSYSAITNLVVTSKFSDKVSLYNQDCKFPHTITFVECSNSCKINNTCI